MVESVLKSGDHRISNLKSQISSLKTCACWAFASLRERPCERTTLSPQNLKSQISNLKSQNLCTLGVCASERASPQNRKSQISNLKSQNLRTLGVCEFVGQAHKISNLKSQISSLKTCACWAFASLRSAPEISNPSSNRMRAEVLMFEIL